MINSNMKFITVEANIGSGKSTFLPELVSMLNAKSKRKWVELQEPVTDPEFDALLTKFYDEPTAENRVIFQMYITNRRYEMCQKLDQRKSYVIERSLLSDLIFSQVNFLTTEQPDGKYMTYYYDIKKKLNDYPRIDACVYLQADPEVSYQRVKKRGRKAEDGIQFSYMQDVHNYHEACLPQICREYEIPLVRYSWNMPTMTTKTELVDDVLELINA